MTTQPAASPAPPLPPGFSLRRSNVGSESDAALMHSLTSSVEWPYTLDILTQWNHYEQIFLVIDDATQRAVAVSCVFRQGHSEATIGATITRPEYRGRGFAYALIAACIEHVQREWEGVQRVLLAATELGARVYRKLGFVECGRVVAMQRGGGGGNEGVANEGVESGLGSSGGRAAGKDGVIAETSGKDERSGTSGTSLITVSLPSSPPSLPRAQWEDMVQVANAAAAVDVDRRQVLEMQLLRGGRDGDSDKDGKVGGHTSSSSSPSSASSVRTASSLLVATATTTTTTTGSPTSTPTLSAWLAGQELSHGKWALGPVIAPDADAANRLVDAAMRRLVAGGDGTAPSPSAISVAVDISTDVTKAFVDHLCDRHGFKQQFTNELMEWRRRRESKGDAGGDAGRGADRDADAYGAFSSSSSSSPSPPRAYGLLDLSFM